MKKIQRLFPFVLIVLTLMLGSACGKKPASKSTGLTPTPSAAIQQKETAASAITQQESSIPTETHKETSPTPKPKEEKNEAKEQAPAGAVKEGVSSSNGYEGLQGEALLKAVLQKTPKKLFVITESISGETKNTSITYMYNDFIRNEADSDEGKQVLIYNPEEEITYTFNEGLKTGMKFTDGEDAGVPGLIDEEDYEDFEGLISAELTTLDGEEVIYMVSVIDDSGISAETRMWISTKYNYPVAVETSYSGMLATKSRVLEITEDFEVDDTLFIVPDDIQFVDFNDLDFLGGMDELDFLGE